MKKRLISILLTLLMVMSLFSGMSVSAYADDDTDKLYVEYTLAQGDYVLRICQKLGINYYTCKEAIMALNNITSENGFRYLSVGEVVKIPVSDAAAIAIMTGDKTTGSTGSTGSTGGSASGSVASGATIAYYLIPYTMQRGETVLGVCNSLGISFAKYSDQIMKINGISSWNKVGAGTTLLLPSAKTPAVGTTCYAVVAHKVVSGDTAYTLCQKYGVSYGGSTKLLQALNNTDNLAAIKVGKSFYMPVATTIKAQSSSTGNTGSTGSNSGNTGSTGSNSGSTGSTNTNAKSYDLTGNINTNYGSMAFYVNNASVNSAKEGDVVTVNVTTKDGRAVESLTVKFADGRADVKLEANSFIMPACDVRVDAAIKSGYDITINSNYSFKTAAQVGGINVSSAAAGSSVKVISTDPGYVIKEITAYYSTLFGMKKEVISLNSQNTFSMPAKDVTIDVVLEPVQTYSFYRVDTNEGSFDIQVDGNSVSKAAKGAKVVVVWQPMTGYEQTSLTVTKVDAKTGKLTAETVKTYYNYFTMPDCPVQIEVGFDKTYNDIDIEAVEGGVIEAYVGGAKTDEAKTGEKVVVKAVAKTDAFTAVFANLTVTRKADGHLVSLSGDKGEYEFAMPAGGVVVSGKLKGVDKFNVTVKFNNAGSDNRVILKDSNGTWNVLDDETSDDSDKNNVHGYAVGTKIYLSTLARDSHAFKKFVVTLDNGDDELEQELNDMANTQNMIVMPNANVTIKAEFAAGEIAIDAAKLSGKGFVSYLVSKENDGVNFVSANSCKIGDYVMIDVEPENPTFIVDEDNISVINKATGKALSVKKADVATYGENRFIFRMPAEGVEISVNLIGKETKLTFNVYNSTEGKAMDSLKGLSLAEIKHVSQFDDVGSHSYVDNTKAPIVLDVNCGDLIAVSMTELAKADYVVDKIEVRSNGAYYGDGVEYNDGKYRFWVREENMTVDLYLKEKGSSTVSLTDLTYDKNKGSIGCTVGGPANDVVTSCKVGDTVYVVPKLTEGSPYYLKAESLSVVRKSDGVALTVGDNGTDNSVKAVYNSDGDLLHWFFVMPEGGVKMSVEFCINKFVITSINVYDVAAPGTSLTANGLIQISVGKTDNYVEVTDTIDQVPYKSTVKVALTNKAVQEGYSIKNVSVPNVKVSNNSFNMPAEDVTVEVILEKKAVEPTTIKLSTSSDKNGTVQYYLDKECTQLITDGKAAVESYVYVKLTPKTGYVIKEGAPTAKNDFDKTTVALGNEGNGVYSFKTGKNDITVSASFVKESYEMTVWVGDATDTINVTVEKTGITSLVKSGDKITVPYNTKVTFAIVDSSNFVLDKDNSSATAGELKVTSASANMKMPASDVSVTLKTLAK